MANQLKSKKTNGKPINILKGKELMKHMQQRFKEVLIDLRVDILIAKKDTFELGWPSFKDNGTGGFIVKSTPKGISVSDSYWDESFKKDTPKITETRKFKSIDEWMKKEFDMEPTSKASSPKKNYR